MTAIDSYLTTLPAALRGHSRERVVVVPTSVWEAPSPPCDLWGCGRSGQLSPI
jgi:hypothetical protein